MAVPIGRWDVDAYAGVWLFTANDDFFPGGLERTQDPILAIQGHVSYTFKPRLWLAVDSTWYSGGKSQVAGGEPVAAVNNSRLGATLSIPASRQQSFKIAFSNGVSVRTGTDFGPSPSAGSGSISGADPRRGNRRYPLRMIRRRALTLVLLPLLLGVAVSGQPAPGMPAAAAIDRDLLDVTVPQLHRLYAERKYTVTQVVQWHLARIDRYNGVYGAIETVLRDDRRSPRPRARTPRRSGARRARPALGRADRHQGQHQRQRPGHDGRLGGLHAPGP